MATRTLQVKVYYETHQLQPGPCCGVQPSPTEMAEQVAEHMNRRYGNSVELEFLDLSDAEVRRRNRELVELIEQGQALLPLITVAGIPRLWGAADFWAIVKAVETHREVIGG